jgi:hypothetical protein
MNRLYVWGLGVVLALGVGCDDEPASGGRMDSGHDAGHTDSGDIDSGSIDSGDPGSCLYDGVRHDDGTEWYDGCNWCNCNDGEQGCTARYCTDGSVDEVCLLPVEPGSCFDVGVERFYYDAMTNTCRPFTAHCGGQGGNGNNFASQDACWQHCGFDL